MVFVACGLNHKTAPLVVREKIALPLALQDTLLTRCISQAAATEAVILSTCNRTEIYCETEDVAVLLPWLADAWQVSTEFISPYLYIHHGHHGVAHLLRVASGLDSMMLGEPQVFGQMKQAYQYACDLGTVKHQLRGIFEYIFSASKRIRHRSGIGNNPISIAYAAVHLIKQQFINLQNLRVFIIGTGETSSLVAKYLQKQGVKQFMVASRTVENASRLAAILSNGTALTITDIAQYLSQADVVISATACPLPFINQGLVSHALTTREGASMFFLDLAVPRDIEGDVGDLEGVHLYNIDDLHQMIMQGMEERKVAAIMAEQLVEEALETYIRQHRALQANGVICDYRSQMQDLASQELQRAMQKLSSGQCQQMVLTEFCERLVNKLTHRPTVGLRQAASDGREELLDLAHYLFNTSITEYKDYEEFITA